MTAEIAIMNRQAIALAADSAVTINYPDGQKIYNSVNKLFMLSKYAPVGIMVYGVADLTGVPWETIIKSFRQELGEKRLPHLEDYANSLISYINGHQVMFTEENQEQQFLASVLVQFRGILDYIDQKLKDTIAQKGSLDLRAVRSVVTTTVRDAHLTWTKADRLPGVPADHAERVGQKWKSHIETVIDVVFEKLPISPTTRGRLVDIAGLVFTADLFPDNVSGVVIAGFGEEEYMPSVVAFDMEGVLLNFVKVRKNEGKSTAVSGTGTSAIIPFAQGEMVYQFMEGVDPHYQNQIQRALDQFVDGLADNLVANGKATSRRESTLRKQVSQAKRPLTEQFFTYLESYANRWHVQPIVSAVANLPKEELATMAESLVSLTSFKRRVTHDPETVGGPIDVAVISKGDGFIWINRKHYFDPTLNHHFFANYYRT
jgi:hypothetical protein